MIIYLPNVPRCYLKLTVDENNETALLCYSGRGMFLHVYLRKATKPRYRAKHDFQGYLRMNQESTYAGVFS